ncbi:amidohydrolase family protein [Actinoalloteichus hoggarensis]|nr:amidohydrolase family protein [Actinoalloteichus hoggarensis]
MGESGRSPMGNSGGPPVEKSGEPPVEGSDRPWSGSGGPPPGDGSVGHSRHDGSTAGAVGGWAPSSGAARWSSAVGALAEAENVVCKLSGLITEASWSDWTVDDIRPYADRLLSTFGPRRLLYGSDWPVCELAGTYGEVLTLADRLTDALSVAERRRVLSTNAREWYRLRG